ncbi:MAG: arginine--tRNA ligase [Clostridia bacterium]|nr:arginine--tRNA ligase [Clostridia bacterium]
MNKTTATAQEQLRAVINKAVAAAQSAGELPEGDIGQIRIEIPADRKNGDYSTNAALAAARSFHCAPAKIASAIVAYAELDGTYFERVESAGPGFINFTLGPRYYSDILIDIRAQGAEYGRTDSGKGKRVVVEFVSANPTGPMHVGNARGGAIGDCLASALDMAGYEVEREFYINDAGNQIEKFGESLSRRYLQIYKPDVPMPDSCYKGIDIIRHAADFAEIHSDSFIDVREAGDRYIYVDEKTRRKALVDFALPKNIAGLERDLASYRITYDTWFRESSLHRGGEVADVIRLMKESGNTYESDGALWFKARDFGCEKDFVLVRSNGIPTYIVPDIAYHYNKLVVRGFDVAIDVLGADHHGYVPRLKACLAALGVDPDRLKVVLMQMVRLVNRDGEIIKASKRSGKAITLVTLLEEVPVDAARFFFNLREPGSHFDFNIDQAVEHSADNPVYYCQYAHARICSVFKKQEEKGFSVSELDAVTPETLDTLMHDAEKELVRMLALLPDEIDKAAQSLDASGITRYIYEVASLFHKFYNSCRIDGDDPAVRSARLYLCAGVKTVLSNVLSLLKVTAPESM